MGPHLRPMLVAYMMMINSQMLQIMITSNLFQLNIAKPQVENAQKADNDS